MVDGGPPRAEDLGEVELPRADDLVTKEVVLLVYDDVELVLPLDDVELQSEDAVRTGVPCGVTTPSMPRVFTSCASDVLYSPACTDER